jgi:hypothetical protein
MLFSFNVGVLVGPLFGKNKKSQAIIEITDI